ncbi:hypothetical protein [Halarcobacter anaerophilus]|uniref:hypothetical protein n=1 Tax=Halarcobacter anaerophilus TaxID=877500 RepID=UPI0011644F8D|nr:hypothetical protein [Halarcobacter anaerophilus]QDF28144.1 putative membrane protein [Halarcobacter anaerophilus]
MCLVISLICLALAYTFFQDSNMQGAVISFLTAVFFIILLVRNILKTKKEREDKK